MFAEGGGGGECGRLDARARHLISVVPAKAGTHNHREILGEGSSLGTLTIRNR
jgi:hypothetical protein